VRTVHAIEEEEGVGTYFLEKGMFSSHVLYIIVLHSHQKGLKKHERSGLLVES
jgi:hypothetical protein